MKLDDLLYMRKVPFQRLHHPTIYGASRIAESLHVPGREMAKTVLLRTEEGYVLTVLPANLRVELDKVREYLNEDWVEMACEAEMTRVFPGMDVGVMPPFGSMFHMRTLIEESLTEDEEIVFEGNSHEEAIRMAYKDYEAIEHPLKGHFACPA
jgi:Ala-tRNA(Pro) deacylase